MFTKATLLSLVLAASSVLAQVTPTSPSGDTVVKQGDDLEALWSADSTGAWKDLEVQLMTGDNWNMVPLAVLAQGLDGTTQTSLTVPCPEVTPNSKIYFLQFTQGGNVSTATWTTRFTIAAADGSTTEPTEGTQPNGDKIGWGTGALVGTSGGASNTTSGAASSASSASVAVSSAASSASAEASSAIESASSAAESITSSSSSSSPSASASRSAANNAASPSTSARPSGAASPNASMKNAGVLVAAAAVFGVVLA